MSSQVNAVVLEWKSAGEIFAIRQISAVFTVLMWAVLLKGDYGFVRLVASGFIFLGVFLVAVKGQSVVLMGGNL